MLKMSHISLFLVLTLSFIGLFQLKFKVHDLREEVTELKQKIISEKESIRVLRAEWAYLNNPDRIKNLAKKYLDLKEVSVEHVADLSKNKSQDNNGRVKISHNRNVKWNYKGKDLKKYVNTDTQSLLATFKPLN